MSRAHDPTQPLRWIDSGGGEVVEAAAFDTLLAELERLAADAERAEAALKRIRNFAESQVPYHTGFKHIVRFIEALAEASA